MLCSSGGQEASSRDFPPTPAERSQHISPRQALAAVPARAGLPTCLGLCSDQVTAAIYVSHTHRHSPAGEMVLPAKAATCWGHLSTLFPSAALLDGDLGCGGAAGFPPSLQGSKGPGGSCSLPRATAPPAGLDWTQHPELAAGAQSHRPLWVTQPRRLLGSWVCCAPSPTAPLVLSTVQEAPCKAKSCNGAVPGC